MSSPSQAEVDPLIDAVASFLEQHSIRNQKIVVAVSGGPDSVALFHALIRLRTRFHLELHVAHLDHMLRGEESAEDAEFVARLAAEFGIPSTVEARDVREFQRGRGNSSLEDAARKVRYSFLNEVADRGRANRIALGHTADDQAETVLLQLVRGAGLRGLRGMLPVRERFIRPLLEIRRLEVERFLTVQAIGYRVDRSNLDREFARNRMRAEILPLLEAEFNPRAVENICRAAHLLRLTEEWADDELEAVFGEMVLSRREGAIALKAGALAALPTILRKLAIRRAILEVSDEELDLSLGHISSLEDLLAERSIGAKVSLPGGLAAERLRDAVAIRALRRESPPSAWEISVSVPGRFPIPGRDQEVTFETGLKTAALSGTPLTESHEAYMDWGKISGGLSIRNRRAGDRFHPLGAPGTRKLKEFFIDQKVPRSERDRIPLLVDRDGIICVLGYVIADRVRVSEDTRELLHILIRDSTATNPKASANPGEKR